MPSEIDRIAGSPNPATFSARALTEALPALVWTTDASGSTTFANARWAEYTGRDIVRDGPGDLIHHDDRARMLAEWSRARDAHAPFEMEYRIRRYDGAYRWHAVRALPLRARDGDIVGWCGTALDIDSQQRSNLALEFLDRISDVLGPALDPYPVLQRVAELAVPEVAEWCAIFLFDERGRPEPVAIAHRDLDRVALAWRTVREYPPPRDGLTMRRVALGLSTLVEHVSDEQLAASATDARHLARLIALDVRSATVAPIVGRDRPLGSIHFVTTSERRLGPDEQRLAEIVGKRLGVALEHAHVYERERHISKTFQQAALSHALPSVPGLDLHAVYVAAEREAEVGGDWYDAFALDDGRVVISIGDVAGKGLEAAVLMGSLRQAIRLVALRDFGPAEILEATSSLVARESRERFATAFVGIIDPRTWSLRYALAAHPPPIFRRPDGTTLFLDAEPSPPLGLIGAMPRTATLVSIPANSMLVLYTDGLIEATRDIVEGERRLHATVASGAVLHGGDPARLIHDAMLYDGVHDDVAVLTVVFGRSKRWAFDARDAMSAQGARSSFVAALRAEGRSDGDYDACEVIFGELVGNVVRHAPGPIDVTLDWSGREPVLHVIDRGRGIARDSGTLPDALCESGRGLFIIATLARSFDATPVPGRGTHVTVRLPVERDGDAL